MGSQRAGGSTQLYRTIGDAPAFERVLEHFDVLRRSVDQHAGALIKTIGDAYMAAAGLPTSRPDHAEAAARMALDMQAMVAVLRSPLGEPFHIRLGLDSGPVVAGVIGVKKFSYDLWGDTVNVASRMESQGTPGKIQVTQDVYERLNAAYRFEARGKISIKGRGSMTTYWLLGRRASA